MEQNYVCAIGQMILFVWGSAKKNSVSYCYSPEEHFKINIEKNLFLPYQPKSCPSYMVPSVSYFWFSNIFMQHVLYIKELDQT